MKIETVTFVYNEQFLLPYYIKHYDFVDKFNIFYDVDSSDSTLEILKNSNKCKIIEFKFPDMMDDRIKVDAINDMYKKISCDIIINVDVDEFIFSDRYKIQKLCLDHEIVSVKFANVFRHVNEADLDIEKSVISQRKHGYFDRMYHKPIIARTKLDISWSVGNHRVINGSSVDCGLLGAHWANADICFCIERRMKNRKARQSQFNFKNKLTTQHHYCTEESIINECIRHQNDLTVFIEPIMFL